MIKDLFVAGCKNKLKMIIEFQIVSDSDGFVMRHFNGLWTVGVISDRVKILISISSHQQWRRSPTWSQCSEARGKIKILLMKSKKTRQKSCYDYFFLLKRQTSHSLGDMININNLNNLYNGHSESGSSSYGTSILGNIRSGEFQLPRGISNIFNKSTGSSSATNNLRNSFSRKKDNKEVNRNKIYNWTVFCWRMMIMIKVTDPTWHLPCLQSSAEDPDWGESTPAPSHSTRPRRSCWQWRNSMLRFSTPSSTWLVVI